MEWMKLSVVFSLIKTETALAAIAACLRQKMENGQGKNNTGVIHDLVFILQLSFFPATSPPPPFPQPEGCG